MSNCYCCHPNRSSGYKWYIPKARNTINFASVNCLLLHYTLFILTLHLATCLWIIITLHLAIYALFIITLHRSVGSISVASGTFLQLNIPPGQTSYVSFTLDRTSDVTLQFSSALEESVRLAIYAKRGNEKPDFAWYDVTKQVSVPAQAGSTEILKYMESGEWVLVLYNGAGDILDVPVTFRFPGIYQEVNCSVSLDCSCVCGFANHHPLIHISK